MKIFTFLFVGICFLGNINANYYDAWLTNYDAVVKKYVKPNGLVDYEGLKNDPQFQALSVIGRAKGKRGRGFWRSFSAEKKVAFYINFHNFLALSYTIKNNITDSIPDIQSAQKSISGALNRRVMSMASALVSIRTLSNNSPKVYFALNRGVIGDPPLRNEAYTGERLEEQLQDQLKKYLSTEHGKKLDNGKKHLHLSSIFEAKEFNNQAKKWLIDSGRLVFFAHDYDVVYIKNHDTKSNRIR